MQNGGRTASELNQKYALKGDTFQKPSTVPQKQARPAQKTTVIAPTVTDQTSPSRKNPFLNKDKVSLSPTKVVKPANKLKTEKKKPVVPINQVTPKVPVKPLPADGQQRPDYVPHGLYQGQTAPVPQAEELKEKVYGRNEEYGAPQNTDLYPRQLPEDADGIIEQYVYMESDRTVRNELVNYRREVMEQLELFREAQKKQI